MAFVFLSPAFTVPKSVYTYKAVLPVVFYVLAQLADDALHRLLVRELNGACLGRVNEAVDHLLAD